MQYPAKLRLSSTRSDLSNFTELTTIITPKANYSIEIPVSGAYMRRRHSSPKYFFCLFINRFVFWSFTLVVALFGGVFTWLPARVRTCDVSRDADYFVTAATGSRSRQRSGRNDSDPSLATSRLVMHWGVWLLVLSYVCIACVNIIVIVIIKSWNVCMLFLQKLTRKLQKSTCHSCLTLYLPWFNCKQKTKLNGIFVTWTTRATTFIILNKQFYQPIRLRVAHIWLHEWNDTGRILGSITQCLAFWMYHS